MAALDKIKELRSQGMDDAKIITNLQEQGISPREINDSIAQSKIKEAVSAPSAPQEQGMQPGMQPSMLSQPPPQPVPQQQQQQQQPQGVQPLPQQGPYAQEIGAPSPLPESQPGQYQQDPNAYAQEPYAQEGYGQESYGQEESGYGGYEQQASFAPSSETISEVASQIINEKMKKTNRTVTELTEIKTLLTNKVTKMDSRLERIENIIDQLQTSLLRKANDQEQNIGDIKTEMQEMQAGFSKILNPLFDIERSLDKPKHKRKTTKKKK